MAPKPKNDSPLRMFAGSGIVTVISLAAVTYLLGLEGLVSALILIAVELAFSFDNAIINAKILALLSPFWQRIFLTIGVVIAIFGMRVVFPLVIVMLTASLPLHTVIDLALRHPAEYAEKLELAHPAISAFGGAFLLMLGLHFFTDDNKDVHWLKTIEKPLARLPQGWMPALITVVALAAFALLPGNHHAGETIKAGIAGIVAYVGINLFTNLISKFSHTDSRKGQQTGFVAFLTFMYLQILDASFSFDGVIGAFAITNDVILIAVGLGVGAIWVRSLTVYMVHKGTLDSYIFLEHGAHYAVLALALTMLVSLIVDVPEAITGTLGLGLIGASIAASVQAQRSGRRA